MPKSTACGRQQLFRSRRQFLAEGAHGFGSLALAGMLARDPLLHAADDGPAVPPEQPSVADPGTVHSLAARPPHFAARAERVILLFMTGGPSQVDTFDPKPELKRLDGQPLPSSFKSGDLKLQFMQASAGKLMGSPFEFGRHGQSGLEFANVFPKLATQADQLAIVRSCYHESFIHGPAINFLCTGSAQVGQPSVGSWITYGLGCESEDLPAYLVMSDGTYRGGTGMYQAGYLPALYQGTVIRPDGTPIQNLTVPNAISTTQQRSLLNQLGSWNQEHAADRPGDSRLEARIASYELAFRMQTAAPELIDVKAETQHTLDQYGVDQEPTARFGRMCLLGRRMVERGVRFVQLINNDWDGHGECAANHQTNAARIDGPIAALLADLRERSLLDSTLVVWCGEFGRTPVMQGNLGRDHSPYGFSVWLAGGGVRGGQALGATDELGFRAVEDRVHVNDLHATMLKLLGLEHEQLTYLFEGRNRRLTDVGGHHEFSEKLVGA